MKYFISVDLWIESNEGNATNVEVEFGIAYSQAFDFRVRCSSFVNITSERQKYSLCCISQTADNRLEGGAYSVLNVRGLNSSVVVGASNFTILTDVEYFCTEALLESEKQILQDPFFLDDLSDWQVDFNNGGAGSITHANESGVLVDIISGGSSFFNAQLRQIAPVYINHFYVAKLRIKTDEPELTRRISFVMDDPASYSNKDHCSKIFRTINDQFQDLYYCCHVAPGARGSPVYPDTRIILEFGTSDVGAIIEEFSLFESPFVVFREDRK